MHPRIQLIRSGRSFLLRPRASASASYQIPPSFRLLQKRNISADEKPLPESEGSKGPNQDTLGHVSEEAAMEGKITGEGGPDLEQSTPVQEVSQQLLFRVRG